jgi:hypothetical protein
MVRRIPHDICGQDAVVAVDDPLAKLRRLDEKIEGLGRVTSGRRRGGRPRDRGMPSRDHGATLIVRPLRLDMVRASGSCPIGAIT